jgi:hypothetical protein
MPSNDEGSPLLLGEGLRIGRGSAGVRLIGEADAILTFGNQLRELSKFPNGASFELGDWRLLVDDGLFQNSDEMCIAYPAKAWGMAGGVFAEASYGGESSPVDFGDVGLFPRSTPDIGVSLIGVTRYDWLGMGGGQPEFEIPSHWKTVSDYLNRSGRGSILYIGPRGWTADIVSLESGERTVREFASAPSTVELVRTLSDRLLR